METYYVVKKGYNVGIFKTWTECKKSVSGYKNPIFRKFNTYDEASLFFKEKSNSNSNSNNIKVINTTSKNKEKTNNINNTIDSILDNSISESQVSNTHNSTNSTNSISDEEFINLQKSCFICD